MRVLADAGPLIGLARIQRLQLLRDLFTSVWITEVIAAEARRQGLFLIGTAAVLVLAQERGLVKSCKPLLLALRDQGYYLSDSLIAAMLKQVGEAL